MHTFDPRHMDRLLSPERRAWQNPDTILESLGLTLGMVIADVGSGPGFFTLPAAVRVGPDGHVYALDIEPAMLERVRERAAAAGLRNIETLVSEPDRLPLPDQRVDLALLANVLHEAPEPVAFLREIRRILRPGGTLAVIEWKKEPMDMGPPLAERLSREQIVSLLQQAGYGLAESFDAGPYHTGLRARPRVGGGRLAAAVRGDTDEVVPLPDGASIAIYDLATEEVRRFPNPGQEVTTGRRLATTDLLIREGVELVASVPLTFCPRSHQAAREAGIRFVEVPPGTPFPSVVTRLREGRLGPTDVLPDDALFQPPPVPSDESSET